LQKRDRVLPEQGETNLVKRLILLLIPLCCLANRPQTERIDQGLIIYAVQYPKLTAEMRKMADVLPMRMTVTFRYHMMCSEVSTPSTYSKTIIDARSRDMTILAHVDGKRILVHKPGRDFNQMKKFLELTEDTMTIAGFLCKKAIVTSLYQERQVDQSEIWYSPDIGSPDFSYESDLPDLRGMMMRYTIKQGDIEMIYQAIKVEPKTIDKKYFAVPDTGYQVMTDRQFMHLMNK
jgi:hypothetical protein